MEKPSQAPSKSMRVLLAEDSAVHRRLVGGLLDEWGFEAVVAKDGSEAWKLFQEAEAPQLVLLDWVLPHIDGIELCHRIRQTALHGLYTYVILLSQKDRPEDLLEGMDAGADDYLMKPFEPAELRARLLAGKRILQVQQELIEARESLRMAATYDGLTKLLNRGEILALLDRELARGQREKSSAAVILADIDHFKAINDSIGHLGGDAVLREVARRLQGELRIYDGVGRYGGEEFLIILPGCDVRGASNRAEELRRVVSSEPIVFGKHSRHVTISLGVTAVTPDHRITIEALLSEADDALYRAKRNGRDRTESARAGS
jgi:two-component system cell cycle response regulator